MLKILDQAKINRVPMCIEDAGPLHTFVVATQLAFALTESCSAILVVFPTRQDIASLSRHSYVKVATSRKNGVLFRVIFDVFERRMFVPDWTLVCMWSEFTSLGDFTAKTDRLKEESISRVNSVWDGRKWTKYSTPECSSHDSTPLVPICGIGSVHTIQDHLLYTKKVSAVKYVKRVTSLKSQRNAGLARRPVIIATSLEDHQTIQAFRFCFRFSVIISSKKVAVNGFRGSILMTPS